MLQRASQGPNAFRRRLIQATNDLRRSIDYLATRKDIDSESFSYYGYSMGGAYAPNFLLIEPRLRAAVLYMAGLYSQRRLPEVDPATFLPRVDIPVLMLSSERDHTYPLETSARPLFQLLGTPDEHKRQVIAEGGHFVPRPILIRETLDWLDRYLDPVK